MANVKPAALRTGKTGKQEKSKRIDAEENLKGAAKIPTKPKGNLSKRGEELYKEIIKLLPKGFLSGSDTYVVGIVRLVL